MRGAKIGIKGGTTSQSYQQGAEAAQCLSSFFNKVGLKNSIKRE
jgi:hypothetical protein